MNNIMPLFNDCWVTEINYPHHKEHKDKLITLIYDNIKTDSNTNQIGVAPHIKYNLIESSYLLNFFDQEKDNIYIRALEQYIKKEIISLYNFLSQNNENVKSNIIESWYHVTRNGGYHDTHEHSHASFAGIYFLDTAECQSKNGSIRFHKPYLTPIPDIGGNWVSGGVHDVTPTEGNIIIFPGFMTHSAVPYFGKKDRIVIAFNTTIVSYDY